MFDEGWVNEPRPEDFRETNEIGNVLVISETFAREGNSLRCNDGVFVEPKEFDRGEAAVNWWFIWTDGILIESSM